jgi:putative flippase GtrA
VHIAQVIASNRFIRFVLVGAFNTALGYGLYLALLFFGLQYAAAWALALGLNLIVAFVLSGSLVFGILRAGYFITYVLAWIAIASLNVVILRILVSAGVDPRWAPAAIVPLNVIVSFTVQKALVFRTTEEG